MMTPESWARMSGDRLEIEHLEKQVRGLRGALEEITSIEPNWEKPGAVVAWAVFAYEIASRALQATQEDGA
jgi:hypothetical protein